MKKICLILALLLLLPGCGGKTLDANTQALVEKSDAVCLVTVKKAAAAIKTLKPGTYYFKVRALTTDNKGDAAYSAYSSALKVKLAK